ncbi:SURF1 family protein [Vibrio kyushuensis]|uniref:SURF1 family protein n=1 Tax=Vibrio kyushuensis TaxID=2910249 RepID=UPI003D0FD75A
MILNNNAILSPICILLKSIRFWFGLLLTLVVFSLLVKLGFWQLSRGEAKQQTELALSQRADQEPIPLALAIRRYQNQPLTGVKVTVDIKPLPLKSDVTTTKISTSPLENKVTFVLDNQTYQGTVGYLAYQVVSDSKGMYFLLERGFIAGSKQRSQLPVVQWLNTPQTLSGRLYQKSTNRLSTELGLEDTSPIRIQNLNLPALSQELGIELAPFVFQPQHVSWPYPQPWQPVPMYSAKHFGYAIQWFSMAVVFAILCIYVLVRAMKTVRDNANTPEPTKLKIKELNHKDMI